MFFFHLTFRTKKIMPLQSIKFTSYFVPLSDILHFSFDWKSISMNKPLLKLFYIFLFAHSSQFLHQPSLLKHKLLRCLLHFFTSMSSSGNSSFRYIILAFKHFLQPSYSDLVFFHCTVL